MTKKKVGIITSYLDFNKNYGGILQAYALSSLVFELGFEVFIMPYIYEYIEEGNNDFVHRSYRATKHLLKKICDHNYKNQQAFYQNMLNFVYEKLPIYRRSRIRVDELEQISNSFCAFISGSDQVWSTKLQKDHCDPGMFLQFAAPGVKRIAYAPSLGSTLSMSATTALEFKSAVCKFDHISAREDLGKKLIEDITGISVPLVLDPTLLFPVKKWQQFLTIPQNIPEHYILLYRFGTLKSTDVAIEEVRQKYNYPIIELPSSAISMTDKYEKRFDIDPSSFIGLIKNASLVLTDSFHCTVFCILMKAQFLCFYRQDPDKIPNMNGRLDDLLNLAKLECRLIKPYNSINYEHITEEQFEAAHKSIDEKKEFSLSYLKTALE